MSVVVQPSWLGGGSTARGSQEGRGQGSALEPLALPMPAFPWLTSVYTFSL